VAHSGLQYPMYEYFKRRMAARTGCRDVERLPSWQAGCCGSVAGALSAVLTAPLDLIRTRVNLRVSDQALQANPAKHILWDEVREIYLSDGVGGFFAGAGLRAAWMGFGGFVFLGSFEWARGELSKRFGIAKLDPDDDELQNTRNQSEGIEARRLDHEPPPSVSFVAGLVAGIAVDVPLHPIDTVKTRLQARQGFMAAGGIRSLWSGLSAVLITSVPGSAIFFMTYEQVRKCFEDINVSSSFVPAHMHAACRDAASAVPAEISACIVRVPCEVMKQRMQTQKLSSAPASLIGVIRHVSAEGISGFFAGFGATVSREVPFALIQMPLFEELKFRHPWSEEAKRSSDTLTQGFIGMSCGAAAGAVAGLCTTPLDVTKTRIMLTARRSERRGLLETVAMIYSEAGVGGLFRGVTPRTVHCCIGGALWLGAFEWVKILLCDT